MSTLWTPGGERPVGGHQPQPSPSDQGQPRPSGPAQAGGDSPRAELSDEEMKAQMELRQQLLDAPAEVVVTNHCIGLFELAALHLSHSPPQLAKAKLAIDALSALVEGLAGRLGEGESQLQDGLTSLQLAYVQLQDAPEPSSSGPAPSI